MTGFEPRAAMPKDLQLALFGFEVVWEPLETAWCPRRWSESAQRSARRRTSRLFRR